MERLTIEASVEGELVYIGAAPNRDVWQRLGDGRAIRTAITAKPREPLPSRVSVWSFLTQ